MEFALSQTENDFVRAAGLSEQHNTFVLLKRWHSRNMQFEIADFSSDRRDLKYMWGLSFDVLLDLDCVICEDQLTVAAPIGSGIPDFSDYNVMSFFHKVFH